MAKKLLSALWAEIALSDPHPKLCVRKAGGLRLVLARRSGILSCWTRPSPGSGFPFEVAGCSGMTCWRQLGPGRLDPIHQVPALNVQHRGP